MKYVFDLDRTVDFIVSVQFLFTFLLLNVIIQGYMSAILTNTHINDNLKNHHSFVSTQILPMFHLAALEQFLVLIENKIVILYDLLL